jgi:hypothetical protein
LRVPRGKAAPTLALAIVAMAFARCARNPPPDDPARTTALQATYDKLHARFERAARTEPLVAAALADRGQVVVAIRSGLIETLAGNVAKRYLDRVTVDLSGIEAHKSGALRPKTFLGRVKLGEWNVSIEVEALAGDLRAGTPRVGLRGPDLIEVEVPVDVQPTEGAATLHFAWDSAGLAKVVCSDFELTRDIRGRILPQRHLLSGALRLANTGPTLTATPLFPEREIHLKLDLTDESWGVVEAALRSQDTFGKCGLVMHPDRALVHLKELAANGITVKLPESIFRTVRLPARLRQSVEVGPTTVGLELKAESLRIETATLWSSASVRVKRSPTP